MTIKEAIKGVKEAINSDGIFPYEWGRDKPLSDQLCLQGYTLATMCLLGEVEIAKKLMKGLLWMEELTGKPGYLPRCVYYGEKEFDYIKKIKKRGTIHGIWNNSSQDQYVGLFFGLHFASIVEDKELGWKAVGLTLRLRARLRTDNYKIKNEDGKTCKHGKNWHPQRCPKCGFKFAVR